MKHRIAMVIAPVIACVALAACPREQTPPREGASVPMPATSAGRAETTAQPAPPETVPEPPQSGRARAPLPEPEPATPPPPPPPVDK